ncbi:MAG: hypothetical protein WA210_09045 [Burkholderiaceae bacterium]
MYLEDFADRLRQYDADLHPGMSNLLMDLARELLLSRPTRPGDAAEEARTPRRMEACLGAIAEWSRHELGIEDCEPWQPIDAELRAMGFLRAPNHSDAGGEP